MFARYRSFGPQFPAAAWKADTQSDAALDSSTVRAGGSVLGSTPSLATSGASSRKTFLDGSARPAGQFFSRGGVEGHAQDFTTRQKPTRYRWLGAKALGATAWVGVGRPELVSLLLDEASRCRARPAIFFAPASSFHGYLLKAGASGAAPVLPGAGAAS